MGYTTEFTGHFNVTPLLKKAHRDYLTAFSQVRHMQREVTKLAKKKDPLRLTVKLPIGVDGAYFIGVPTPSRPHGDRAPASILSHNHPPMGQPELHCQWVPTSDGKRIVWDGGEKFYEYVAWLQYLVDHFLAPWGYQINGEVSYQGQYPQDHGRVVAVQNKIGIAPSRKKPSRRAPATKAPKKVKIGSGYAVMSGMERLSRESIYAMLEATKGNQRAAAEQLGLKPSTLRDWMAHYKIRSEDFGPSAKPRKSAFRRERVVEVLSRTRGNQTQAAKLLGTSHSNFHHLMKQYQIAPSELQTSVGSNGEWEPDVGEEWAKWKEGYQHTVEGKLSHVAALCHSTPARVAIVAITSGLLHGGTIQDALFALDNIAEMYDAQGEFYDLNDELLYEPLQRLDGLFLVSREPLNARLHALQTGSPWGAPQINLMKKAFGLVQRIEKDPLKDQALRYVDSILRQLGSQLPAKEAKAVAKQVATIMLFPAFFRLPEWLGVGVVDGQISFLLSPEVIPSLAVYLARKPMQEVVDQHLREIMSASKNLEIQTLTFSGEKIKARKWMDKDVVDYREAFRLLIAGLYTRGIELIDSAQVQAVASLSPKKEKGQ
jgi:DNA-binding protein Fis